MRILLLAIASLVLASCALQAPAPSSTVSPAVRAEFAPTGTLVAGINYGNGVIVQRDPAGGPPRGIGPELARELARRLGVPIRYVTYESAGTMGEGMKRDGWDIAFFAVDPARAALVDFSAPYVAIDGTYLVRNDSPLTRLDQFDRPGLRIAVGNKSAYDLWLTRNAKQSEPVRVVTSQDAVDTFLAGKADAAAGVRQALEAAARKTPGLRVIDGAFMTIGQASSVPKGRPNAARYLNKFIEEMKASGFVARKLRESGVEASVAPPAGS